MKAKESLVLGRYILISKLTLSRVRNHVGCELEVV